MATEWPVIDPATVAPLRDGKPDMFKHIPTRFVSQPEAAARGWAHFYDGSICRYGHKAPHFTSNPRLCVDCKRIRQGLPAIGAKDLTSEPEYSPTKRAYTQREIHRGRPRTEGALVVAPTATLARQPEPTQLEKTFLREYADCQDMKEAAERSRMSYADVLSRMAWSDVFKNAVHELEEKLGIKHTPPPSREFEWTEEKRSTFIRMYINTGLIDSARDAILATPYDYYQEIERNPDFANRVAAADPLAANVLEEVAVKLAVQGSDKLLVKVLAAKKPDTYRESLKLDVTNRLVWDDSKKRRLQQLLDKCAGVIDAKFEPVNSTGATGTPAVAGSAEPRPEPESNLDLL